MFTNFAGYNFISVLSSCTIIVYLTGLWELGRGSASAGVLINEALSPDCGDGSETDTRSAASGYLQISTSGYLHTSRRVSPGPGFLLRPWHVALGHQDNSSPPQPQQTFNSTQHSTEGGDVVTSSDHLVIVEVMSCDRVR